MLELDKMGCYVPSSLVLHCLQRYLFGSAGIKGEQLRSNFYCCFSEFEKQKNLPPGLITKTVISNQENGAWVRMERGELTLTEFAEAFSKECSQQVTECYAK